MKNCLKKASIQFFKGEDISCSPKINIYREDNGRNGKARFLFNIGSEIEEGRITSINKMIMLDQEGELVAKKINLNLKDEDKKTIEVIYSWREDSEFKRFMRFAENYSEFNKYTYTDDKGVN
tara:strand:+ start:577 stop:942 length:366 start_codon:yes stop_codon:yes gene_type:complete